MLRPKQRSQAVVEFGIIALLFTLLVFAVIDFGLLLNTWLAVSSGSREIARSASVGKDSEFMRNLADHLNVPAVDPNFPGGRCCTDTSAIEIKVEYLNSACLPNPTCIPLGSGRSEIFDGYPFLNLEPTSEGTCPIGTLTCYPVPDELVRVTVIAHGAQVITPLVRPFFGCTNGSNPNCYVDLNSTTIMRFEGREF